MRAMDILMHILIRILMAVFLAGVAGCLLVIPIVAVKFASVLFEPSNASESE